MGLLSTSYNTKIYDIVLLLLRITVGCFMMSHGLAKLTILMADGPVKFGDPIGIGAAATISLAIFAEVICSFLIMLGLATRLAVIPLIITMLVAIFIVHANDGFERQELPGLYLAIYILLLVTGSGKYSIDQLIEGRRRKINY